MLWFLPVVVYFICSFRLLFNAVRVEEFNWIIAACGFRFTGPVWFRQRQNLQQDFCEPFRWLGWHAHLC